MLRHVSKIDIANEWLINRKYSIGITVETENILKIHVYHQTNVDYFVFKLGCQHLNIDPKMGPLMSPIL